LESTVAYTFAESSTALIVNPKFIHHFMKLFTLAGLLCASAFATSMATAQCVAPPAPTTTTDTVQAPGGAATLTATGDSVLWYSTVGGAPIASGNTLDLPMVTATTTYYATNVVVGGGELYNGGKPYHTGSLWPTQYNQNAHVLFNVLDTATLVSVKVYTDMPGDRVILMYDANDNLVAFDTIYVEADSMVLNLNFPLLPGTGYYLTTDTNMNKLIVGNNNYAGPRLRRNSSNVMYPYAIGPAGSPLVSITGNDVDAVRYFYFYDWVIQAPTYSCESVTTPAEVFYDNSIGVVNIEWSDVNVFPNPATGTFYVNAGKGFVDGTLRVYDVTGREALIQHLGNAVQSVDASALAAGVYTVKIQTVNGERVTKLVMQR
jgi:hypothetical protein